MKDLFNGDFCVFWEEILKRKGLKDSILFLNYFVRFALDEWWLDIALLGAVVCKASSEKGLVFCSKKYAAIALSLASFEEVEKMWMENEDIANCLYHLLVVGPTEEKVEDIARDYKLSVRDASRLVQISLAIRSGSLFARLWELNPSMDELVITVSTRIDDFIERLKRIESKLK